MGYITAASNCNPYTNFFISTWPNNHMKASDDFLISTWPNKHMEGFLDFAKHMKPFSILLST